MKDNLTGFVATMRQILVHAPWLSFGASDWDPFLLGVVEKVVAAFELVVEDWVSPGCYDFDCGLEQRTCWCHSIVSTGIEITYLQRVESELEPHLVVAFTGAAMRHSETALSLSD